MVTKKMVFFFFLDYRIENTVMDAVTIQKDFTSKIFFVIIMLEYVFTPCLFI